MTTGALQVVVSEAIVGGRECKVIELEFSHQGHTSNVSS